MERQLNKQLLSKIDMNLNAILSSLPSLDQVELATLRAAVTHLIVEASDDKSDETAPLYDAMAKLLGISLTYRDFHNVQPYRTWKRFAPTVVFYIEKTFPETTKSKVLKIAIMTFLLEALIDDLKHRGVPISLGTVTVNISRLPQIFDEVFPGYKSSGLASLVLDAMKRKREG